jgi:hypothetical protein
MSSDESRAGASKDVTIEPRLYDGEGTKESPFIVKFLPGDQTNPFEWSERKKWLTVVNVSVSTLCVVSLNRRGFDSARV